MVYSSFALLHGNMLPLAEFPGSDCSRRTFPEPFFKNPDERSITWCLFLSQIFLFFVLTVLKLKCAAAARLCSRSVNAKGSPVSCLTLSVVAHIVRLVLPHSKRLLLSRGYLIVRGR